jgi:hypothetical protein
MSDTLPPVPTFLDRRPNGSDAKGLIVIDGGAP